MRPKSPVTARADRIRRDRAAGHGGHALANGARRADILRRPAPDDRRAWLYSLSPEGLEKSIKVREAGREINEAALAGLSEAEREALLAGLAKVVGNLEAYLAKQKTASG